MVSWKLIELCKKERNCEIIVGLDHNYDLPEESYTSCHPRPN